MRDTSINDRVRLSNILARVCKFCMAESVGGINNDGVWDWDDPNSPDIPLHPRCRCTYDLRYSVDRTNEFRAAASMAGMYDLEMPLNAIKVINKIK